MTMADEGDPTVATSGIPAPETPDEKDPPISEDPTPQPEPASKPESLIDAIADLLQMTVNWLRAEAADIVRDKVVLPVQQLGLTLASAMAAGCLVVIGLSFVSVAVLMLLAAWLGWPGALLLIGGVILLGAGIFTYVKMRSIQK